MEENQTNHKKLMQMLKEHPFLEGISPRHLATIAEFAAEAHFDTDEYMLLEDEEADTFYLLHQGQVVLRSYLSPSQGFANIQYLGAGEIVGWSWLVPPHQWHFSALVVQPAVAVAIDGKRLRQACEADSDLGYEILKRLAFVIGQRLRRTRKQLVG